MRYFEKQSNWFTNMFKTKKPKFDLTGLKSYDEMMKVMPTLPKSINTYGNQGLNEMQYAADLAKKNKKVTF